MHGVAYLATLQSVRSLFISVSLSLSLSVSLSPALSLSLSLSLCVCVSSVQHAAAEEQHSQLNTDSMLLI